MTQIIGNIIEICRNAFYDKDETDGFLVLKSDVDHTHSYVTENQMNNAIEEKLKEVFVGKTGEVSIVNGGTTCTGSSSWHGHYEVFDIVNVSTMYIRALNSLSGGYLQDRKIAVEECMMKKISQPSLCIIKKK